jgi:hypothetical protein
MCQGAIETHRQLGKSLWQWSQCEIVETVSTVRQVRRVGVWLGVDDRSFSLRCSVIQTRSIECVFRNEVEILRLFGMMCHTLLHLRAMRTGVSKTARSSARERKVVEVDADTAAS